MGEHARGVLTLVEAVLTEQGEPGGVGYARDSVGQRSACSCCWMADRVTGAVLLCTGAKIGEPDGWAPPASAWAPRVWIRAERWFAPGFLAAHADVAAQLLSNLQHADREGYAQVCEALAGFDVRDPTDPHGAGRGRRRSHRPPPRASVRRDRRRSPARVPCSTVSRTSPLPEAPGSR